MSKQPTQAEVNVEALRTACTAALIKGEKTADAGIKPYADRLALAFGGEWFLTDKCEPARLELIQFEASLKGAKYSNPAMGVRRLKLYGVAAWNAAETTAAKKEGRTEPRTMTIKGLATPRPTLSTMEKAQTRVCDAILILQKADSLIPSEVKLLESLRPLVTTKQLEAHEKAQSKGKKTKK